MSDPYAAPLPEPDELRAHAAEIVAVLARHGLRNPRLVLGSLCEVLVDLDEGRHYGDVGRAVRDLHELTGRQVMLYPAQVRDQPGSNFEGTELEPLSPE